MKKIISKKLVALLIGAFALGAGGTVLYKAQTDSIGESQTEQNQENTEEMRDADQSDSGSQNDTIDNNTQTPNNEQKTDDASSPDTALGSLGTSVTATGGKSKEIQIYFYLEGWGTFTVQEKSGGIWKTTKSNITYPGKGGLLTGTLSIGETSKTIRVFKVEKGKNVSVTKSFTITRSAVESAGGIKTYN